MNATRLVGAAIAMIASIAACSNTTDSVAADSADESLVILHLAPPHAATAVDPSRPIVITFSHPLMRGMEAFVMLHEASVSGPLVPGTATWSPDRTVLTFTPAAALKARTTYVLHLAPALRALTGERLNRAACERLGGRTVTPGMLGSGPHGGMNGNWSPGHGWRATDGTLGMIFTFTTA